MLKASHVFQKLMLVFSVLALASCNPDFNPPPNVGPPGNGQIIYNFSGTNVTCTGIGPTAAALFTTEPFATITGININPNANANNLNNVYTHRVDFAIDNIYSMNDLVGQTIPLQDDVVNASTDMYFSAATVSTLNPVKFYEFTELNFQITNVTSNTISGTFSGTLEEMGSGDVKTVTNGQLIDVYYVIE